MFAVRGKVALVTGGASGIGTEYVKSLLKNEIKGVAVVDVNLEQGKNVVEELKKEFANSEVTFVQADVSDKNQFEEAFKKTTEKFNQLDIVINNAGIGDDKGWEKEVRINCDGLVYGTVLAVEEYLPKYRSGEDAVVVNISSIYGLDPIPAFPVYSGTKHFVLGFSVALGNKRHYEKTKVRVLTICPGITSTPILNELPEKTIRPRYAELVSDVANEELQPPEHMGKELITVLEKGESGSVWLIEGLRPAAEIELLTRFQRIKK